MHINERHQNHIHAETVRIDVAISQEILFLKIIMKVLTKGSFTLNDVFRKRHKWKFGEQGGHFIQNHPPSLSHR